MSTIIGLTERGEVVPPPAVVRRLHDLSPDLGLRHLHESFGAWAITLRWREDDPRRAMIRAQEIADDPHDIIGYAPYGCAADEVPAFVERQLRESGREDARALAGRIRAANDRHQASALDAAFAPAEDAIATKLVTDHVPRVYQNAPSGSGSHVARAKRAAKPKADA
jgi:hypothetical protein